MNFTKPAPDDEEFESSKSDGESHYGDGFYESFGMLAIFDTHMHVLWNNKDVHEYMYRELP